MFSKSKILRTCAVGTLVALQVLSGVLLPSGKAQAASRAATDTQYDEFDATLSGPSYVTPGSNITYELAFLNTTSQPLINIVFWNPLPVNTTYVTGGTFNSGANRVEFTLASLAAKATHKFAFVVKVGSEVALGTVIENKNLRVERYTTGSDTYGHNLVDAVGTTVEAPGTLVAVYKDTNGLAFDVKVDGFKF